MSDVRALLRSERAARRVNHPQAQYSPTGVLSCKACRTQLKSDALWASHLTSSQHINTLKRLASGLKTQATASAGTKRKAEDEGDEHEDALTLRKRTKADSADDRDHADNKREEPRQAPSPPAEAVLDAVEVKTADAAAAPSDIEPAVDEDEWAAFERDVATPPPDSSINGSSVVQAQATISAAPMTAAEIAARSRQEASIQAKEKREAEMEGEKEDAQRRLEEEFDQMEELDQRLKRLKDKREALRKQAQDMQASVGVPDKRSTKEDGASKIGQSEEDEDESDYDDDWGDWGRP